MKFEDMKIGEFYEAERYTRKYYMESDEWMAVEFIRLPDGLYGRHKDVVEIGFKLHRHETDLVSSDEVRNVTIKRGEEK